MRPVSSEELRFFVKFTERSSLKSLSSYICSSVFLIGEMRTKFV